MATQNQRAQSAVKLANHNVRCNCIVISFLELEHILTVLYIYIYIYTVYIIYILVKILKNMN